MTLIDERISLIFLRFGIQKYVNYVGINSLKIYAKVSTTIYNSINYLKGENFKKNTNAYTSNLSFQQKKTKTT